MEDAHRSPDGQDGAHSSALYQLIYVRNSYDLALRKIIRPVVRRLRRSATDAPPTRREDGERASNERRRDGRELNHTIDETIDQYRSRVEFLEINDHTPDV